MYVVSSLAFHTLTAFAAILIGWSTEARSILSKRAELIHACGHEGIDERIAFELADVDRYGIERRLMRAGIHAMLVNTLTFMFSSTIIRQAGSLIPMSHLSVSRLGMLCGLCATVVWSGYRVRRYSDIMTISPRVVDFNARP